ncbi:unnamed protein product [Musa banksii]
MLLRVRWKMPGGVQTRSLPRNQPKTDYKMTSTHIPLRSPLHFGLFFLPLPSSRLSRAMILGAPSALFLRSPSAKASPSGAAYWLRSGLRVPRERARNGSVVAMAAGETNSRPMTGVVFEPFEELKQELAFVPSVPDKSIARQKYSDECEAAINEQINVEYSVSYVYHALFAYFDRDNVALKGLAKFFKESSDEEREHADKLMEYQNMRGGRVKLQSIMMPLNEFDHPEKGDALHAMEIALSLEKLTNEKLLNLHKVAERCNDIQMADFIETEFLGKQVEDIKKISEYVARLRRVGKGHGVWHFDQVLLGEGEEMVA